MQCMAMPSGDGDRRTQFLRGTADLLLLATIADEPGHAYELATRLSGAGLGPVSYGTVYPLLARLRSAGLLSEASAPSTRGPSRKVYALTPSGREALQEWSASWHQMHQATAAYLRAFTSGRAVEADTGPEAPAPSPSPALTVPTVSTVGSAAGRMPC